MPLLPSPKNPLSVLKGFRNEFETRTNITNFDRDTKVRAISDVLTDEILQLREEQIQAFYASQLSNAVGDNLDELGTAMGKARREASFADVLSSEQNLAFYVETGDFGTINSGLPIPITAGTQVKTQANGNELNTSIIYEITEGFVLPATSSIYFVSAKARVLGSKSNVGAEVLRQHSFTGYTDALSNTLKVVNFYPILNGTDRETDNSYRYRLAQHYATLNQVNNARISMEALRVPGVLQTKVMPGYYGIGTAAVAVMGAEFQTNDRMLRGVQEHINATHAPAHRTQAIASTQVSFDFNLEIKPSRSLNLAQQNRLRAEIRRAILGYFRRRTLGDVINLENLARMIQTQTRSLVSLDAIGSGSRLFKKSFIRRGFAGGSTDERRRLKNSIYQLNDDEFAALGTLSIEFV